MATSRSSPPPVQVIERAGALLDCFTATNPAPTLAECAAMTGLNKSSAYRILVSLERIGLVERLDKRWRIGQRTVALAGVRLGNIDLRREASSRLKTLGTELRAATSVAVPVGSMMAYVERHESPEPFAPSTRLGAMAPIWAGASGRAVLACLDQAGRDAALDDDEWRRLPASLRTAILSEADRAAQCGYATDTGSFFQGVAGVATAIQGGGEIVATMSVIVTPERLASERERLGDRLLAITREVERAIAIEPPGADGG